MASTQEYLEYVLDLLRGLNIINNTNIPNVHRLGIIVLSQLTALGFMHGSGQLC